MGLRCSPCFTAPKRIWTAHSATAPALLLAAVPDVALGRCSRRGSTSSIHGVVPRQLLLRCSWPLFQTWLYLGNCSCVVLGRCSRRGSTSSIHGVVPPASMQSSGVTHMAGECRFCMDQKYLPMPMPMPLPCATVQLFRSIPLYRVRKRSPTGWAPTGERYRLSVGAHPVRDRAKRRRSEHSERCRAATDRANRAAVK